MSFNWIDLAILGIIGLSVVTGLFRGFVKELISLCVWILAFWLAYNYSSNAASILPGVISDPKVRIGVAAVCILIVTLIAGGIFNGLLSFIVTRSGLSSSDRLLGMGFGFVRGVFIVAIIILGAKLMFVPTHQRSQQSVLYAKFEPLVNWLEGQMPDFVKRVGQFDPLQHATQYVQETTETN